MKLAYKGMIKYIAKRYADEHPVTLDQASDWAYRNWERYRDVGLSVLEWKMYYDDFLGGMCIEQKRFTD